MNHDSTAVKTAAMPRESSQRYVASGERRTRPSRSSANFVDSLLPAASSPSSSAPLAKKIRLNSNPSFRNDDSSLTKSSVNSISDVGIESATASVQSFLASSALSSLVFGNASGKDEKFENGNQSSGCESSSPTLPQSGRSSAIGGYDESSGIVAPFLSNEEEECSPPPSAANANGEPNGAGSNYYTCIHCNKYFWTETSLKHHSSLYHSEKSFVCEICGKAFRFRSNLAEHRSVHTSLKPYVCKFCGKSSRLKGNLTKHILKHHKKEQNAYIGKDDIIIKKGKKSVKDPAAVDFLEKSMIVLTSSTSPISIATAPLPSSAGKKAPTDTVSSSNAISTGPFSLNTTDLGSAALQLLSMASKTEPNKSSPRSSSNKRGSSSQSLPLTAPSLRNGNKVKAERSVQQRDTSSIFAHSAMQTPPFLPMSASNRKSPSSTSKEPNRFPMITSIGEDFVDSANYLLSADGGPKFDYDEIFGSTSKIQPVRDVDAIFESLLGRHLGQSEINYSPPLDDLATSSPAQNLTASASLDQSKWNAAGGSGVGTRCQLCGKHFRKSTNLAVHMSIKHNQAPLPVGSAGSSPPPAAPARGAISSGISSILNTKFPTLTGQSISQPKTSLISTSSSSVGKPDSSSKLTQRQNGSASSTSSSRPSLSTSISSTRPLINAESIMQASSVLATPQLDTLNGLMTKSGVSKDLKEIRNVLQELKRGLPDVAKLDELLSALDARVDRLERQLETSVNTLYILVQMQTDMNSAFCQFKNDVVQRLKSLKAQHAEAEEEEEECEDLEEEEEERESGELNGESEAGTGSL